MSMVGNGTGITARGSRLYYQVPLIPGTVVRVCCFCVLVAIPFTLVQAQQPAAEDVVLDLLGSQGWRAFELARLRERNSWLRQTGLPESLAEGKRRGRFVGLRSP